MPASKKNAPADSDEELESIHSAKSSYSESSIHTDDTSSGEEIDDVNQEERVSFYKYPLKTSARGSEDPMVNGSEQYSVVTVGTMHIGLPEPAKPMPNISKDWTVLHDRKNNEYVSALRCKQDAESNVVRYYVLTNFDAQKAAATKLYSKSKLSQCTVANLSLGVHGLTTEAHDPSLLEHADLAVFKREDNKIVHIFDTPYAKRLISRAAKAAKNKAAKRKAPGANTPTADPKAKRKKPVSAVTVTEESDAEAPTPAKKEEKSPVKKTVGTTPKDAPPLLLKQTKLRGARKLEYSPISPRKQSSAGKLKLRASLPIYTQVASHLQIIMELLGVSIDTPDKKEN